MTESCSSSGPSIGATAAESGRTSTTTPKSLGAIVTADLEALRNDLEQAQTLAEDYRWQLAGKSNECAELRYLLEKTQRDLLKVQSDIGELRKERHRLANEAMKVQLLDRYVTENAKLRDQVVQLEGALHALLSAPAQKPSEPEPLIEEKSAPAHAPIIELDFEA